MNTCLFENQQHSDTFWEEASGALSSVSELVHQGELFTLNNDCLSPENYALTKKQLIKVTGLQILEVGDVRWVTILPFEEPGNTQLRCGFTIKHKNEKIDFYAADQNSLDRWLGHLEKIAILQDAQWDYTLGKVIGRGGQSVVRLGTSVETGEQVAIKSYDKRSLEINPKRYQALVNEITILRELSHPNIVKMKRVYEGTSYIHLVMEYVAGTELYEYLKIEGKFNKKDASKFMWNLLDTLQYLEERNVVHQDIKPENIILTDWNNNSQFKLVDFGLAMKYEGTDVLNSCGSPGYIAPEILLKRKHGPKVDTYSAGILFYVLLSGYSPFFSPTREEILQKNCDNDIIFGSDWSHIDSKLVRIIRMMTNITPELRMSIADLKDWLSFDSPSFPSSRCRRASEVDILEATEWTMLARGKASDSTMERNQKEGIETRRELRNVVIKKTRRGSLPCDPTS